MTVFCHILPEVWTSGKMSELDNSDYYCEVFCFLHSEAYQKQLGCLNTYCWSIPISYPRNSVFHSNTYSFAVFCFCFWFFLKSVFHPQDFSSAATARVKSKTGGILTIMNNIFNFTLWAQNCFLDEIHHISKWFISSWFLF